MKAFLLAAGLGTRLRPLTLDTPKCLIPIANKPLIDYWIDLFEKYNINDVLINTHYLANKVEDYIGKYSGKINFTLKNEEILLGSGGTLYANQNFIKDEEFLICYADNLTNINLSAIPSSNFTMALFTTNNPTECGIATLDKDNNIIDFVEKPKEPAGRLANAGIYLANPTLFTYLPAGFSDLGKDIITNIPNKKGYIMTEYLRDIGTFKNYYQAQEDIKNGRFYM